MTAECSPVVAKLVDRLAVASPGIKTRHSFARREVESAARARAADMETVTADAKF